MTLSPPTEMFITKPCRFLHFPLPPLPSLLPSPSTSSFIKKLNNTALLLAHKNSALLDHILHPLIFYPNFHEFCSLSLCFIPFYLNQSFWREEN